MSFITSVASSVISARLMNNGPTVPRTNRLKVSSGMNTGAPLSAQKRIDCETGENETDCGVTGPPVAAAAIGNSTLASAFNIGSTAATSAKDIRGAPANSNNPPSAGSTTT